MDIDPNKDFFMAVHDEFEEPESLYVYVTSRKYDIGKRNHKYDHHIKDCDVCRNYALPEDEHNALVLGVLAIKKEVID
ncbi:MAG: hypothetical protein ISS36_02480 [Candidatus Aenigmarchaeota archaeon]|nr:hypothetical protein [Candidatus Aenigmarchaeota archaeon]